LLMGQGLSKVKMNSTTDMAILSTMWVPYTSWQEDPLDFGRQSQSSRGCRSCCHARDMGKSSFTPMIIEQNLGILIHGDGSFAGKGIVYEMLHLGGLPN
jgi:hypothetical protein